MILLTVVTITIFRGCIWWALVLLALSFVLLKIVRPECKADQDAADAFGVVFQIIAWLLLVFTMYGNMVPETSRDPQAIDVYRGKTELVVRSYVVGEDGLTPWDSVVVWKK